MANPIPRTARPKRAPAPKAPAGGARAVVRIEQLIGGGFGLARLEAAEGATAQGRGEVVLVSHVAIGESVAVEIDRTRRPARGRLLKVLAASADRVTPPCPVFEACGACDFLHLSADAQRSARLAIVRAALPEAAREVPITWHSASPERGRTRARWHAKALGARGVMVGPRALGSHTIVDLSACHALDPRLEAALEDAHALLAGSPGEGEIFAALGVDGLPALSIRWNGALAAAAFREAEERVRARRLAGVELWTEGASVPATIGDARVYSPIAGGETLIAPPGAFAQASAVGDAVLNALVVERAQPAGRRVVELFSGSGNFTVALARLAAHVTSVELAAPACAAARSNLQRLGLAAHVRVIEGDADQTKLPPKTDLVVLDPPRSGARGACAELAAHPVPRVVYVSCDPATLGRDLAALLAVRYQVAAIDAVDLFPGTSHVETVVTLLRP